MLYTQQLVPLFVQLLNSEQQIIVMWGSNDARHNIFSAQNQDVLQSGAMICVGIEVWHNFVLIGTSERQHFVIFVTAKFWRQL